MSTAPQLEDVLRALPPDPAALVRSVRARIQGGTPPLVERFEPRGAGRGELSFSHRGDELMRLLLRPDAPLRVLWPDQSQEAIEGLRAATRVAESVRATVTARVAQEPQLDLFGGPRTK